jgi:hypothetical protein
MGQTASQQSKKEINDRIRYNFVKYKEIKLNERDSITYINDINFRNEINDKVMQLDTCLHICLNNYTKMVDTNILTNVHILNLEGNNKIKDIGNLKKLKKVTINDKTRRVHLLKDIEEVVINMKTLKLNKDITSEIRKLKKINPSAIIRVEYTEILGNYEHADNKAICLDQNTSILYATNKEIRDNIDKMVERLNTELHLNLDGCKEQIDTNNLRNVHTLSLIKNKKIKNVGDLSKLKKLTFNKEIEGLYLLKEVEEITIRVINGTKPSKKVNDEIKKLKKINPNVKVEIVEYAEVPYGMNYNIMRIMSGMGGLYFSN